MDAHFFILFVIKHHNFDFLLVKFITFNYNE